MGRANRSILLPCLSQRTTRPQLARRDTPALSVGSYVGLEARGSLLASVRTDATQQCLVVLNLGPQPQVFASRRVEIQGSVALSTCLDRAAETVHGTIELRGDEGVIV